MVLKWTGFLGQAPCNYSMVLASAHKLVDGQIAGYRPWQERKTKHSHTV